MSRLSLLYGALVFSTLSACQSRAKPIVPVEAQPVQGATQPRSEAVVPEATAERAVSPRTADSSSNNAVPALVQDGTVENAMARLVDSLSRKDVPAFLELYSKKKPFRFIGTIHPKRPVTLVTYDELERDLKTRDSERGWYSVLFDGGPDDSLALTIEDPARRPWKRVKGQKFVPPGDEDDSTLFITWRKEGGQWVVESIGYPGS